MYTLFKCIKYYFTFPPIILYWRVLEISTNITRIQIVNILLRLVDVGKTEDSIKVIHSVFKCVLLKNSKSFFFHKRTKINGNFNIL